MKTIYKYLIAAAVGAILTASVIYSVERNIKPKKDTTVVVDTVLTTVTDSTGIKPTVNKVVADSKPIVLRIPNLNTTIATDTVSISTQRYTGKEVLSNGTIDYEIYADNLVATNFHLTTEETTIVKTVTETTTLPAKSKFYITGGLETSVFDGIKPQAINGGIMYNRKQKWGVGAEIRQDFSGLIPTQNSTTIGLRLYIGI